MYVLIAPFVDRQRYAGTYVAYQLVVVYHVEEELGVVFLQVEDGVRQRCDAVELVEEVLQIGKLPLVVGATVAHVDNEVDVAALYAVVLHSCWQRVCCTGENLGMHVVSSQYLNSLQQVGVLERLTA